MGFVVEVTSRSGRVIERHHFEQGVAKIGRAYDNDVILSDPYVHPYHLRIGPDEDGLVVERLEVQGRTQLDKQELTEGCTPVRSGGELVLGRTHLRVLSSDHAVEPTLTFEWLDRWFSVLTRPLALVLCFAAYLVIDLGNTYLHTFGEIDYAQQAVQFLSPFAAVIAWAAMWAVVTRITRGEARFFHHCLALLFFLVLKIIFDFLIEIVAFNTGSLTLIEWLEYLASGVALAVMFSLNLRFAFRQSTRVRQGFAQAAAWSFVGFTILTSLSFSDGFHPYPKFDNTLLPDSLLFTKPVSEEVFLEDTVALFSFPLEEEG